jgi:hypothetical protein
MVMNMNKHPYKKHSIVAVNTDGSVSGYFESIKEAVDKYGMDRHSITDSCKRGNLCRGLRWFYMEDFKILFFTDRDKLKYELNPDRDRFTQRLKKGVKLRKGLYNFSTIGKQRIIQSSRKNSILMCKDPNNNWGKSNYKRKKVICVETGEIIEGVDILSKNLMKNYSTILYRIHKNLSINGYHYKFNIK